METKYLRKVLTTTLIMMVGMPVLAQQRVCLQPEGSKAKAWINVKPNESVERQRNRLVVRPKQMASPKKDEAQMVKVKCVLEYNADEYEPEYTINALSKNSIETLFRDLDYTQEIPIGEYDFICVFRPIADDNDNLLVNIKEKVNVKNDITLVFDASECKNHLEITAYSPDGEVFKRNRSKWNPETQMYEVSEKGNVEGVFVLTNIFRKDDCWGLFNDLSYGYYELYFNDLSDRFIITETRMYDDETEKQQIYINKFFTDDVTKPLQNRVEDYYYHEESFDSSIEGKESSHGPRVAVTELYNGQVIGGGGIGLDLGEKVKMYVNAPFEDAKAQNRFDLLAAPAWSDVIKDKIWDFGGGEVYIEPNGERHIINGKPVIYENGEARYINIGHDDVWGSSLSILMKNNDGIVPYNPNSLFSYSAKQKALNYGSSTPINLFWKIGQWIEYFHSNLYNMFCCYIGRYGEVREVDNSTLQMTMKLNGEDVECNYENFQDILAPYTNPDRIQGDVDLTFDNKNVMVDGLQGRNLTNIHYNEVQEDVYSPTLTMLWFKNKEDIIIDRFDMAEDGTLEFSAGDLNFNIAESFIGYFDCKEQSVAVSYSPYNKEEWSELAVEEIPENFFMPGFGYFYRGSLKDVTGAGEKGWFDLKIKLTDVAGNWQEQVISPAFRIDDKVDTGIGNNNQYTITNKQEVYDLMGRKVGNGSRLLDNGYCNKGISIVRRANGDVRKVVNK